jgi:hypothetical protein
MEPNKYWIHFFSISMVQSPAKQNALMASSQPCNVKKGGLATIAYPNKLVDFCALFEDL